MTEWLYNRSHGVLLVVQFNGDGIVQKAGGRALRINGNASTPNPATQSTFGMKPDPFKFPE